MDNQINSTALVDEFYALLNKKIASTSEQLQQVRQTIEQSQTEIARLTQRTSTISAQLQKYQGDLMNVSGVEIRDTYSEAMDSQQRLLLMRGQLDKLVEQKNQLSGLVDYLEELKESYASDSRKSASKLSKTRSIETLEMLITAQETERQRLSRQMHDGPAQALSNLIVQAEIAAKLFEIDPGKARVELEKIKSSAMSAFHKIRNFVTEIRPMMLDDLGLIPTLHKHVALVKENSGVNVTLTVNGREKKLEPYLEVFLFRTVQELIENAIKRNQDHADLQIDTVLTLESSRILLSVMDNGKEYSAMELMTEDGLGINLIEERVKLLGGTFRIQTTESASVEILLSIPVLQTPVE